MGAGHDGAAGARPPPPGGRFEAECHDFLDLLPPAAVAAARQLRAGAEGGAVGLGLAAARAGERTPLRRARGLAVGGRRCQTDQGRGRARRRPRWSPPTRWPARRSAGCGGARAERAHGNLPHRHVGAPALGRPGVDLHLALHAGGGGPGRAARRQGRPGLPDRWSAQPAVRSARPPSGCASAPIRAARRRSGGPGGGRLLGRRQGRAGGARDRGRRPGRPGHRLRLNEGLRERLDASGAGVALGWVDDMPALLRRPTWWSRTPAA